LPVVAVLVVVLVATHRSPAAVYLATVSIGASVLTSTAKSLIGRTRPPLVMRASAVGGSAFPSGHATQAAASYVALLVIIATVPLSPIVRRALSLMLIVTVTAVGLSRLHLGVHRLTDVLAAWALRAAWALGAARAFVRCGLRLADTLCDTPDTHLTTKHAPRSR
jgi:undecaprenyl-diphosphatase